MKVIEISGGLGRRPEALLKELDDGGWKLGMFDEVPLDAIERLNIDLKKVKEGIVARKAMLKTMRESGQIDRDKLLVTCHKKDEYRCTKEATQCDMDPTNCIYAA